MLVRILSIFNNMDITIKDIVHKGFVFSNLFCVFSTFILIIYLITHCHTLYIVGLILFRSSLMFYVDFIIMGIGFDTIKKQII